MSIVRGDYMAFEAARCKNCNGDIQVDVERKTGFCPYCGTKYITEDVINNYNTYNNYKIENATIKLNDEHSVENKLKNAEINLSQFKDYKKAEQIFREVTEIAPGNYRGWWGLVRSITQEFSLINFGLTKFNELNDYVEHALIVADNNGKNLINSK